MTAPLRPSMPNLPPEQCATQRLVDGFNTDATRQENVLDFVGNVAEHVQVLVVTCHGERYRGIGTSVTIQADEQKQ